MRIQIVLLSFLAISFKGFTQEVSFLNADGFFSIGTSSNKTASITLFAIDYDGDLDALVANGRHCGIEFWKLEFILANTEEIDKCNICR